MPVLGCLVLAAASCLVAPASAQQQTVTFAGYTGTPISPQCVRDNNYEYTHAEGETMFFPGNGCTAAYNPRSQGIASGDEVRVMHIEYFVTGHVGTICGHFDFSGRVAGSSPHVCTAHDQTVSVSFETMPSSSDEFIVLTWRSSEIDNAYMSSFQAVAGTVLPPVEPEPESPCAVGLGPECVVEQAPCMDGAPCLLPSRDEACEQAVESAQGLLLPADCSGHGVCVDGQARCLVPRLDALCEAAAGGGDPACPIEVPCVAGSGPSCVLPAPPCVAGPSHGGCIVPVEGCGDACRAAADPCAAVDGAAGGQSEPCRQSVQAACVALSPTGIVGGAAGSAVRRTTGMGLGYALHCRLPDLAGYAAFG